MIKDAESILKVCGLGTILYIGCQDGSLVFSLLKKTADAYGLDTSEAVVNRNLNFAPGRFVKGALADYPFQPETFDTIVIGEELLNIPDNNLPTVFKVLYAMTKRNLVLYFPNVNKLSHMNRLSRLFWDKLAIDNGFRHHLRSMLHTPYHELEDEKVKHLTFYQRILPAALAKYPLTWLTQNRSLKQDMTREMGRRADSHIARYILAAQKIRAGDTVLDISCGLGAGTAILAACSQGKKFIGVNADHAAIDYGNLNFAADHPQINYHAAELTQLSFLADHSIDTVVSFDTLATLPDYHLFLKEIKRILKPDGRIVGSVPNLWCDESGKNPLPPHLHAFDWTKLYQNLSQYFIVEERWAQTAGGGYKLQNGHREMYNISVTDPKTPETEWWIFSACADPNNQYDTAFKLPLCTEQTKLPLHIDFAKYYDNPWLYRSMVQLGERIANRELLMVLCVDVVNRAKPGSADQGAALCVLAYQMLEAGQIGTTEISKLVTHINKYDQAYDRQNPHSLRWAISLHYVAARLLLMFGNRVEALSTFITCAEMQPWAFSPLLATKTISARMYAGLIMAGSNRIPEARKQFEAGIDTAQQALQSDWHNIVGDNHSPLLFGLQEIAEIADIASQCAQAIAALDREQSVPGYFWERINLRRFGLVEWVKSVENENERLRRNPTNQSTSVHS